MHDRIPKKRQDDRITESMGGRINKMMEGPTHEEARFWKKEEKRKKRLVNHSR